MKHVYILGKTHSRCLLCDLGFDESIPGTRDFPHFSEGEPGLAEALARYAEIGILTKAIGMASRPLPSDPHTFELNSDNPEQCVICELPVDAPTHTVYRFRARIPKQRKKLGRPTGVTMPCGWNCGESFTENQMRVHFRICPNLPAPPLPRAIQG